MWEPDSDIAQLVSRIVERAKTDAILEKRDAQSRAAERHYAEGTLVGGAMLSDVEKTALDALNAAGSRAIREAIEFFRRTYGKPLPNEVRSWLRERLSQFVDGMASGLTGELEENRKRQAVHVAGAGERLLRAASSLKLDLDVELAVG